MTGQRPTLRGRRGGGRCGPVTAGLLEWLVRMLSCAHSGPQVGLSALPPERAPGLGFQGLGSLHLPSPSVQSITHSDLLCGLRCTSRGWKRRGGGYQVNLCPQRSQPGWEMAPHGAVPAALAARAGVLILGLSHPSGFCAGGLGPAAAGSVCEAVPTTSERLRGLSGQRGAWWGVRGEG